MNAADIIRIAAEHGMTARDDPAHEGEVYVRCRHCGWGDEAPVVAEKYARDPFGCHRCGWAPA